MVAPVRAWAATMWCACTKVNRRVASLADLRTVATAPVCTSCGRRRFTPPGKCRFRLLRRRADAEGRGEVPAPHQTSRRGERPTICR